MAVKAKRRKQTGQSVLDARERPLRRGSFVINYTITLLAAAFLLIAAFASLEAQDQSSSSTASGGNQARRALLAPDVSMSGEARKAAQETAASNVRSGFPMHGKNQEQVGNLQTQTGADDEIIANIDKVPGSADIADSRKVSLSAVSGIRDTKPRTTSGLGESYLTASTAGESSVRQTRATTTKKHNSDGLASSTTLPSAGTTLSGAGTREEVDEEEEAEDEESKPTPPAKTKRRRRRKKKTNTTSGTTDSEKQAAGEDKDQEQVGESEAEEQQREKARVKKPKTKGATTSANSTSQSTPGVSLEGPGERTTKQSVTNLTLQPSMTSTVANKTSPSKGDSKVRVGGSAADANSLEAQHKNTAGGEKKTGTDSSLDHEYYDDDEPTTTHADETRLSTKKPVDFSAIKLIGLDKWNESVAGNHSTAQPVTPKPAAKLEPLTLPTVVRAPTTTDKSPNIDVLNSRSPPGQSIGKRITNLLTDAKSKLIRSTTTMAPTSPRTKFAYSKPYSTATTIPAPVAQRANLTADGMFVQILNQNEPANQSSQILNNGENLDWSKLVKVVFKSSLDNHTVYTLVMNASELSGHPINDWSSELPKLLQGDFEKLIQKWSNVFPLDHLMTDLGRIIINRISASPTNSSSIASATMAKLNQTIPSNSTSYPGASNSTIHNKLAANLSLPNNSTNQSNSNASMVAIGQLKPTSHEIKSNFSVALTQLPSLSHNNTYSLNEIHTKNDTTHRNFNNTSAQTLPFETNSSMTSSSPRGLNVSAGLLKPSIPSTSSRDVSDSTSEAQKRAGASNSSQGLNNSLAGFGKTSRLFVSPGSSSLSDLHSGNHTNGTIGLSDGHTNITNKIDKEDHHHDLAGIIKDMNEEHVQIGNDVRERVISLRHFIIVCSVSIVVTTSLIILLIVKLLK